MISLVYRRHKKFGLAEVYVRCQKEGYTKSYGSMCCQIRKCFCDFVSPVPRLSRSRYEPYRAHYPGDMVQMDIKYVPRGCLAFESHIPQYYQITAIDLYTRKHVLEIVDECSVTHTSRFAELLSSRMGLWFIKSKRTARRMLNFRSPQEVLREYLEETSSRP